MLLNLILRESHRTLFSWGCQPRFAFQREECMGESTWNHRFLRAACQREGLRFLSASGRQWGTQGCTPWHVLPGFENYSAVHFSPFWESNKRKMLCVCDKFLWICHPVVWKAKVHPVILPINSKPWLKSQLMAKQHWGWTVFVHLSLFYLTTWGPQSSELNLS